MFNARKTSLLTLAVIACATFAVPAQAQSSLNDQPVVGSLHQMEASLQAQLNRDYQLGLIDPFELANRTRDLDAIRVKEEAFRMRKQGMTPKASNRIAGMLTAFQADLNNRCQSNEVRTVANR